MKRDATNTGVGKEQPGGAWGAPVCGRAGMGSRCPRSGRARRRRLHGRAAEEEGGTGLKMAPQSVPLRLPGTKGQPRCAARCLRPRRGQGALSRCRRAHGLRMTPVMPVHKAPAGERALPQTPRAPSWGTFLPVKPPLLRAEATFLLCVIWGA